MASIVFATVIATVLFFYFERTRAFGIIGVFILIALEPVSFTVLFAVAAIIFLYIKLERK